MLGEEAFIGLGSNLEEPNEQIKQALIELHQSDKVCVQCCSHLYKSAPMGPKDQPDFTNAVCKINTMLDPYVLLDLLQDIENKHKRSRQGDKWGPRTLDLDILLFQNRQINCERLTIPHYGMSEREFVLVPMFEISPDLIMPDGRKLAAWVSDCDLNGLRRLKDKVEFSSIAA